jgi:HEAT repeat protein
MATTWIPTALLLVASASPAPAQPLDFTPNRIAPHAIVVSAPAWDDLDDLLRRVKKEGDGTPPSVFGRIAGKKNEKAFNTLRKAVGMLRDPGPLSQAYSAFQAFQGTEQQQASLDYLEKEALRARRAPNKRGATMALVRWGTMAKDELTSILESKADPELKYLAARPMVATLGERGDVRSLKLLLRYGPTGPTASQEMKAALDKARGSNTLAIYEDALSDKSTKIARKIMLLELLDSWKETDAYRLVAGRLRDPHPDIVVRALEILGASNDPQWTEPISKLLRSKNEAILRDAILAMGRLSKSDETWVDQLFALADDKNPAARMGAAAALLELRTPQAVDILHSLLDDQEWRVRSEALQQVGNLRREISIPVLIKRLDVESGRVGHDMAFVLRLMTGEDHGRTGRRWSQWWKDQGENYRLPSYEDALKLDQARSTRRKDNKSQASFYGLEIVSDRVMFIIDQSGSMAAPAGRERSRGAGGGPTRLDVAVKEFGRALAALADGIEFNVIFFETGVESWKNELLNLDVKQRADATTYAKDKAPAGGTNVYGALLKAYEDERIDTIYLLTDGGPSAGEVTDTAEIRRRILRLNRTRRVVIHCISIGTPSPFLRELARENGGSYTESL